MASISYHELFYSLGNEQSNSMKFLFSRFQLVSKVEFAENVKDKIQFEKMLKSLNRLKLYHILKLLRLDLYAEKPDQQENEECEDVLHPFIVLLFTIYRELEIDFTTRLLMELGDEDGSIKCSGIEVYEYLLDANKIDTLHVEGLKGCLKTFERNDLVKKIEEYEGKYIKDGVFQWHSKIDKQEDKIKETQDENDFSFKLIDFEKHSKMGSPMKQYNKNWRHRCRIEKCDNFLIISIEVKGKLHNEVQIPLVVEIMYVCTDEGDVKDIIDDGTRESSIIFHSKIPIEEIQNSNGDLHIRWSFKSNCESVCQSVSTSVSQLVSNQCSESVVKSDSQCVSNKEVNEPVNQ